LGLRFEEQGFVTNVRVHAERSATHLRWQREFGAFVRRELGPTPTDTSGHGEGGSGDAGSFEQSWAAERHFDVPLIWEMASDKKVVNIASELLGSQDIMLFSTFIFCKFGRGGPVPVHRDVVHWPTPLDRKSQLAPPQ
jgi:hypothetical protein